MSITIRTRVRIYVKTDWAYVEYAVCMMTMIEVAVAFFFLCFFSRKQDRYAHDTRRTRPSLVCELQPATSNWKKITTTAATCPRKGCIAAAMESGKGQARRTAACDCCEIFLRISYTRLTENKKNQLLLSSQRARQ